jgi:hypothetical protein
LRLPWALTAALAYFTGTTAYYRYWLGITHLTDGVKFLADNAHCYWLLDAIGGLPHEWWARETD